MYFLYYLEPFTLDSRCPVFPLPVLYCIPNKNSKHQTGSSSFSWKIPWKTIPYPKEQSSLFNINYNFRQFNHLCGNCIMKTLTSSFDPQQFVSISYQQIFGGSRQHSVKIITLCRHSQIYFYVFYKLFPGSCVYVCENTYQKNTSENRMQITILFKISLIIIFRYQVWKWNMRKYFSGICFSEKGTQVLLYSIITNIFLSGTEYRFSKLNH